MIGSTRARRRSPAPAIEGTPEWVGRSWTFTVFGSPGVKERSRHDGTPGSSPRTTEKTVTFEQRVAGAAAKAGVRYVEGAAVRLLLGLWLPDRRTKDGDNVLKAVKDGLVRAGLLVLPDDNLNFVQDERDYLAGYSRSNPRTVITFTLTLPVPFVFEDEDEDVDAGEPVTLGSGPVPF